MRRRRKPSPPDAGLFAKVGTIGSTTDDRGIQITGMLLSTAPDHLGGPRHLLDHMPRFTASRGGIEFVRPPKPRSWLYRQVHAKRILRERLAQREAELAAAKREAAEERAALDRVRRAIDPCPEDDGF